MRNHTVGNTLVCYPKKQQCLSWLDRLGNKFPQTINSRSKVLFIDKRDSSWDSSWPRTAQCAALCVSMSHLSVCVCLCVHPFVVINIHPSWTVNKAKQPAKIKCYSTLGAIQAEQPSKLNSPDEMLLKANSYPNWTPSTLNSHPSWAASQSFFELCDLPRVAPTITVI